jgi:hypothetical protein
MEDIKDWWNNCPFFNKMIIQITIFIYLLSFFWESVLYLLIDFPVLTIYKLQIFRLLTSCFVHISMNYLIRSVTTTFFPIESDSDHSHDRKGRRNRLLHLPVPNLQSDSVNSFLCNYFYIGKSGFPSYDLNSQFWLMEHCYDLSHK